MKVVVIGGSGHIGSYLVPKLVRAGYKVVNISRGKSKPYKEDNLWREVENIVLNRDNQPEGEFERKIAALCGDIVVDLINFSFEHTKSMSAALKNTNLSHYLYCSSIWAHGRATSLPIQEDHPKFPLDEYGMDKAKSETYLHNLYRKEGFPETVVMPGQISGPGWMIINPVGNLDVRVYKKIQNGEEIALPNFGMETLHHVHADDVAQVFVQAITHRNNALGESFHAVGSESITLYAYAQALYRWFGHEEKLKFLPWEEWCAHVNDITYSDHSYYHIARSGHFSIEKGKRLIEYYPRHTLLETVYESMEYLVKHNWLDK